MSAAEQDCRIVVMAKAPEPGRAKTRLIPLLGAAGAARLAGLLLEHALATARAADIGPVTLACAPEVDHPFFIGCAARHAVDRIPQDAGDLGARMHAVIVRGCATAAATLVMGSDCPALTAADLRAAAAHLRDGADVVLAPAEDGGYALIGMTRPHAALFADVPWGSDGVLAATRDRIGALGLRAAELRTVWDVDRPADYERLVRSALIAGLGR